eukprot:Clim_evm5s29 gene=Clim_evmTU5s29
MKNFFVAAATALLAVGASAMAAPSSSAAPVLTPSSPTHHHHDDLCIVTIVLTEGVDIAGNVVLQETVVDETPIEEGMDPMTELGYLDTNELANHNVTGYDFTDLPEHVQEGINHSHCVFVIIILPEIKLLGDGNYEVIGTENPDMNSFKSSDMTVIEDEFARATTGIQNLPDSWNKRCYLRTTTIFLLGHLNIGGNFVAQETFVENNHVYRKDASRSRHHGFFPCDSFALLIGDFNIGGNAVIQEVGVINNNRRDADDVDGLVKVKFNVFVQNAMVINRFNVGANLVIQTVIAENNRRDAEYYKKININVLIRNFLFVGEANVKNYLVVQYVAAINNPWDAPAALDVTLANMEEIAEKQLAHRHRHHTTNIDIEIDYLSVVGPIHARKTKVQSVVSYNRRSLADAALAMLEDM